MPPTPLTNPFPGLRPFEPDEDHLFFGREAEVDDLLRRLRFTRFLAIVGTSGCGKSSLVRSGLIPSLQSGAMAKATSSWRIAIMRPGQDPIGHLAAALDGPDVLGARAGELATTNRVMLEATLRRGGLGLVDAVRQARIADLDNVLVLVDQFEELFRFRRSRQMDKPWDEAVAFVKLLLEAARQTEVPVFVALTMRSDFIGDCMIYPGLPQALNEGQYLVPRMTRDQLRSAITGPVAVADGRITPRLVLRLLNDVGDDQDDLPLLQHALMRTWDHWRQAGQSDDAIDLVNYEAIGTLTNALSMHAEEAYLETGSDRERRTTELLFRALTDTHSDPRGIRRPTPLSELATICEVEDVEAARLVEIFRRPGRSFLMPPAQVPLTSGVIVDLSHESLMRCWGRLIGWAAAERVSASLYTRLSREATWFEEGMAGLWDEPELELGLRWRRENRPSAAWARRYDDAFDRANEFLNRSEQERNRKRAERRSHRIRRLLLAWGTAAVFLVMFLIAARQYLVASAERTRAQQNLRTAATAVDQLLVSIDRDPTSIGADVPEMQQLRQQLLERAKPFYDEFIKQDPTDEDLLAGMANAAFKLGHIHRMLGERDAAVSEYDLAIARFTTLAEGHPERPEYRQALGAVHNWLGETLRPSPDRRADAERAYGRALDLQNALTGEFPSNATYQRELARTHYNRGILYGGTAAPGDAAFARAESDMRRAVLLLEPISAKSADLQPSQELARASNNLATLLEQDDSTVPDAMILYRRAIVLLEGLLERQPRNREYKVELAKYSNNLSELLRVAGNADLAEQANQRALALIADLARPAQSLGIERADAHNLRGHILQASRPGEALPQYRMSLRQFVDLAAADDLEPLAFNERYGDLLQNLASFCRDHPGLEEVEALTVEAVAAYIKIGERAIAAGSTQGAQRVVDTLSSVMPELTEQVRRRVAESYEALQRMLR
jgi:tetratricopeptide (TPR) repeat protein